jgi:hypothetical protein
MKKSNKEKYSLNLLVNYLIHSNNNNKSNNSKSNKNKNLQN